MGYKRLLKNYMGHVEHLLGTPLVASTAASKAFSKRDLGELGAIAAELSRNGFNKNIKRPKDGGEPEKASYGEVLALCLQEFDISIAEAAAIAEVSEKKLANWCQNNSEKTITKAQFTRTLTLLIYANANARYEGPHSTS